MRVYEEYRGFWAICCIVGLAFAAYIVFGQPALFESAVKYLGHGKSADKLAFIGIAFASGFVVAAPLYLLAKIFGINIKEKPAESKGNELDDIRNRS